MTLAAPRLSGSSRLYNNQASDVCTNNNNVQGTLIPNVWRVVSCGTSVVVSLYLVLITLLLGHISLSFPQTPLDTHK